MRPEGPKKNFFDPPPLVWRSDIKRYQGQNSVSNRNRHSERPAQRIYDRHSVSRRGTAYWGQAQRKDSSTYRGQAQRIEDRYGVSKTDTAYRRQAQCIEDRYSVSRTTTSYWGKAQRIEEKLSVLRKSSAYRGQAQRIRDRRGRLKTKNLIIPCQREKHSGPTGDFNRDVLLKGKIFKGRFNLFRQPLFLLLDIMSGFLVVSISSLSEAPNENIVQNHLKITLLNVF